jgi:hypothetical protein
MLILLFHLGAGFMSLRLSLHRVLPVLAFAVMPFAITSEARARSGTAIGVDVDYTNGIKEPAVNRGTGFGVRLGYKLDLLLLQLTPEIGGAYHTFSGDAHATFSQGFVGGRLALGKILEPGVYAHLGYGHVGTDFGGHSGVTADGGLTLDLTFLPLIDIGVHGGYNGLLKSGNHDAFDSYVLGVHGALVF